MADRYRPKTFTERFAEFVDVTDSCWIWTGSVTDRGYGSSKRDGRTVAAHRWVYEEMRGPIADGMTLDHLCRNKRCVNPDHLEPVTRGENVRRHTRLTTTCPAGHDYTPENTRINDGKRRCRACQREAWRARKANA